MQFKAKNGHVLVVRCKDPFALHKAKGSNLLIASLPTNGVFIGKVIGTDEDQVFDKDGKAFDRPHICKVGDIIYLRKPDITVAFGGEGGEDIFSVRESMISVVLDGVEGNKFTPSEWHELQRMAEAERRQFENEQRAAAALTQSGGLVVAQ